jgi:hypothetical protein
VEQASGLALGPFATPVVAGSGGNGLVAGHLLHRGDVGSSVEQVAHPRAAAVVGRERRGQPRLTSSQLEAFVDGLRQDRCRSPSRPADTRFAEPLSRGIAGSELLVFDDLSHAGLHQDLETFNRTTFDFLLRQRSS